MGIHISCDSCYKSQDNAERFVTIKLASSSNKYPINYSMIICNSCMTKTEYLHLSLKNPNYIKPAEPEIVDEVKSSS